MIRKPILLSPIGKSLLNYIGIETDRYDFPIYDVINNDVHKCMRQPRRITQTFIVNWMCKASTIKLDGNYQYFCKT